jgi:hypothetical protein
MQGDSADPTASGQTGTIGVHDEEVPPGLPPDVVRAIALLDRLEKQAEEIRMCVEEMRASVNAVLAGS